MSGGTTNAGTDAGIEGVDLSQQNGVPFRAGYLDDQARQVLFSAQLQQAAKHPPAPAAVLVVQDPNSKVTDCAICTAMGRPSVPEPSTADFAVLSIARPTRRQAGLGGTFTITIVNQGGTAASGD